MYCISKKYLQDFFHNRYFIYNNRATAEIGASEDLVLPEKIKRLFGTQEWTDLCLEMEPWLKKTKDELEREFIETIPDIIKPDTSEVTMQYLPIRFNAFTNSFLPLLQTNIKQSLQKSLTVLHHPSLAKINTLRRRIVHYIKTDKMPKYWSVTLDWEGTDRDEAILDEIRSTDKIAKAVTEKQLKIATQVRRTLTFSLAHLPVNERYSMDVESRQDKETRTRNTLLGTIQRFVEKISTEKNWDEEKMRKVTRSMVKTIRKFDPIPIGNKLYRKLQEIADAEK